VSEASVPVHQIQWVILLLMSELTENVLYFSVFPQIVVSGTSFGRTEQVLTLVPDKNFASAFFPEEVDTYIQVFRNRQDYLVGGHVAGYELSKEPASGGRLYVRATQHVQ
jgi:hypothetical protein